MLTTTKALDNSTRRVEETLRTWYGDDEDVETMIADTLADLRHLCDRHGVDYYEADRRAYDHYSEEVREVRLEREEAA